MDTKLIILNLLFIQNFINQKVIKNNFVHIFKYLRFSFLKHIIGQRYSPFLIPPHVEALHKTSTMSLILVSKPDDGNACILPVFQLYPVCGLASQTGCGWKTGRIPYISLDQRSYSAAHCWRYHSYNLACNIKYLMTFELVDFFIFVTETLQTFLVLTISWVYSLYSTKVLFSFLERVLFLCLWKKQNIIFKQQQTHWLIFKYSQTIPCKVLG